MAGETDAVSWTVSLMNRGDSYPPELSDTRFEHIRICPPLCHSACCWGCSYISWQIPFGTSEMQTLAAEFQTPKRHFIKLNVSNLKQNYKQFIRRRSFVGLLCSQYEAIWEFLLIAGCCSDFRFKMRGITLNGWLFTSKLAAVNKSVKAGKETSVLFCLPEVQSWGGKCFHEKPCSHGKS